MYISVILYSLIKLISFNKLIYKQFYIGIYGNGNKNINDIKGSNIKGNNEHYRINYNYKQTGLN